MNLRSDLAYDLAVRVLDEQRSALDSMRTRAALLLGLAAIVNVELGRLTLGSSGDPEVVFVVGGAVLAATGAYLLGTLCLGQKLKMYPPPMDLITHDDLYGSISDEKLKGTLVAAMEPHRLANAGALSCMETQLKAAMASLVVSSLLWLIFLWTGR